MTKVIGTCVNIALFSFLVVGVVIAMMALIEVGVLLARAVNTVAHAIVTLL